MRIKALGSAFSLSLVFFHDTGATNPSIHQRDLVGLQIPLDYDFWSFPVVYKTANGNVQLPTLWLGAAFAESI
jgi:hypothetical protein